MNLEEARHERKLKVARYDRNLKLAMNEGTSGMRGTWRRPDIKVVEGGLVWDKSESEEPECRLVWKEPKYGEVW
jgi:hypothetical protein